VGSATGLWDKGKGNSIFTQYALRFSFNEWRQLEIHSNEWTESDLERCIPGSSANEDQIAATVQLALGDLTIEFYQFFSKAICLSLNAKQYCAGESY
jgi:hypothetical protein